MAAFRASPEGEGCRRWGGRAVQVAGRAQKCVRCWGHSERLGRPEQ